MPVLRHAHVPARWPADRCARGIRAGRVPGVLPDPDQDSHAGRLASERMSAQYVYTMHRLTHAKPPDKTVLNEVTLAFLPGAKIGVLGYSGSGKSTLLRIMAGKDPELGRVAMLGRYAT